MTRSASAITNEPRRIALVIPTWNGGARFEALLDSLAQQELGADDDAFQLVVFDSGSTDGTLEAARRAGALVESIDQSTFNHGRTRNLAIERSGGFSELPVQLHVSVAGVVPKHRDACNSAFRQHAVSFLQRGKGFFRVVNGHVGHVAVAAAVCERQLFEVRFYRSYVGQLQTLDFS